MAPLRLAGAALVALLFLAPTALAAPARGDVDAGLITIPGPAQVDSSGLDVRTFGADVPTLALELSDVSIQRLGNSRVQTSGPGSTRIANSDIDEHATFATASITLVDGAGDQLTVIRSLGPASASLSASTVRGVGGALLGSAVENTGVTCDSVAASSYCIDVLGVYELAGATTAQIGGELRMLLYGPTLRLTSGGQTTDYASGVRNTQAVGPAAQTEDAWVLLVAKGATGTLSAPAASLYSAAPTIRASSITLQDASGNVRVGALDYRATSDDVLATGDIVLSPGPVAAAASHGTKTKDGVEPIYASGFTTRVSGDVQSINLNAKPVFLDTPAKQAGFAAVLAILIGGIAYAWQHISFGFAALYTRLNKPDILDNNVRNHIYDIIRGNPGVSAREVHRRSDQSWGTVVYHLRQLERHHLVVSRSLGRTRNYYENHGKYRGMEIQLACLQSDRARVLARAIVSAPGITQEQLATASGYPQPTTSYYVRKLKQAGLIEEQREGRYVKYVPHADLPRYVAMSEQTAAIGDAAPSGVNA